MVEEIWGRTSALLQEGWEKELKNIINVVGSMRVKWTNEIYTTGFTTNSYSRRSGLNNYLFGQ
jgi:hypothetical protein